MYKVNLKIYNVSLKLDDYSYKNLKLLVKYESSSYSAYLRKLINDHYRINLNKKDFCKFLEEVKDEKQMKIEDLMIIKV